MDQQCAREEPRPLELWAGRLLSLLKPVLPRSARANPPEAIARAMLEAACSAKPGLTVVASKDLL